MNTRVSEKQVNDPRNWGNNITKIRREYARRIAAGELDLSAPANRTSSTSVYMKAVETVLKNK